MTEALMDLKIFLPFKIFAEIKNVKSIVLDTKEGSYGLLPHRLDCVAALIPGIFSYEAETGGIQYLAVDEGILVKAGTQIMVSVRNAIGGADLGKLHETVEKDFVNLDAAEKNTRTAMAKLESGFVRSLEEFRRE